MSELPERMHVGTHPIEDTVYRRHPFKEPWTNTEYVRMDVVREMMERAAEIADYRMNKSPEDITHQVIKERFND